MATLIRDVRIFDGQTMQAGNRSVLVEGGRIAAIGETADALDNAGAETVVEGKGRTLMPGMVEAHAHLTWASSVEKIYHQFILPPEELKVAAWRNARVLLDHGFTSAYSAGALGDGIEVELAKAIEAGETPGPRLVPSTLERSPEGAEGVETGDVFNGRGPDAIRKFVTYCKDQGIGSLKLVVSGEDALKPGSAGDVLYTDEEMEAAGVAAREAGLWIATHAYYPKAIELALKAGARIIYHASYADEAAADAMVAAKDATFYAPSPGVSVAALEATPPPHIDMSHMKKSAAERMELESRLVPALKARGVRILIGGDYGFPFNPNGRNARDLEIFVEHFAYTPAEALTAATKLGGELMGIEVGQVREGYLADLLLVDGDPTQDVGLLQDKNRLAMIMKGGAIYKAAA
ncbi:amidohydrolase (plasmid) [Novosphingobium aromaticivorans DSM 12444]|uniref:Amidohydrolase n=1 Tax=Novosphingobium aromaticivorans (strain ATCC 700278 / DSM 12444 / CCUG 56034 / CIP 105152 / NBRC 16084 / F199) TaxID=279238 RepID=A4XEB1_NOVAD|nr:amidohydrolase family protein [Novosphingobium aromaticivorans]ABP64272.1 amidohydrolase [Novosphingobium aromaticivorans DSM 12444]SCY80843.1 Imidazolonepropionase [Novosphingobium aromaticivorans]